MLKKRLIFTLLVQNGCFMLSRNFSLQAAGDINWVREHYDFESIAFSIDELVILDVDRGTRSIAKFSSILAEIGKNCFMPIAAGGGIRGVEDAQRLLKSGADKIVINTPLFTDPDLVRTLVKRFGSQCVIASIDYRRVGEEGEVLIKNGTHPTGMSVPEAVSLAQRLGAGELYLTSVTRDGTGQGLDLDYVSRIGADVSVPIIISGGAGTFGHLSSAIRMENIAAVSTANLFNFMSDNLTEARRHIVESGTPLAMWEKMDRVTIND